MSAGMVFKGETIDIKACPAGADEGSCEAS